MERMLRRAWESPTFTTWGSLGARLGSVLLVLPLVLTRFPVAEAAVWQLFGVLFMLALLLDFGMAPTFARLLAYARGGASVEQMTAPGSSPPDAAHASAAAAMATAARVFAAQRWLYGRLALAVTLVFAVAGTWALLRPVAATADPTRAWWAWSLVLLTLGAGVWGNGYAAALQGMDRIAVLRRWEIGCSLGQIATTTLVLLMGGGLLELVASYQIWVLANALRNRWLVRREFAELVLPRPQRDPAVMRSMWPAAWRSGLGVLMSQGVVQASGVAYGQYGSPADVAAYLLALRVATTLSQFSQAPFYSKLPDLAAQQVGSRRAAQIALAQRGMRMAHWVFAAGAVAVAVAVEPALTAIGSQVPWVPPMVWACMALAFFAERFGAMHLQLYSVTNHIVWHIANGCTGVLMIVLAVMLHPWLGLLALPMGMLVAYACFFCVYSFGKSSRAFGFTLAAFERGVSVAPALVLGLGLAAAVGWSR
jgi:hypothetical protein